jgi:hypothetical protein
MHCVAVTYCFGISLSICFGKITCRYSKRSSESVCKSRDHEARLAILLTSIRVDDPVESVYGSE